MSMIYTKNNGWAEYSSAFGFVHLADLPTLRTDHTIGSIVYIIETGEKYVLDEARQWCLIAEGGSTELSYQIVPTLPDVDKAAEGTVYLVKNETNNYYTKYIKSGDTYYEIGSTEPDLENIVTTDDLSEYVKYVGLTDGSISNVSATGTIGAQEFEEDGVSLKDKYLQKADLKDSTVEIKNINTENVYVTKNIVTPEGSVQSKNATFDTVTINQLLKLAFGASVEGHDWSISSDGDILCDSISVENANGITIANKNIYDYVVEIAKQYAGSGGDPTPAPTPTPLEQVQVDWNETDTSSVSYIKNKPVIPSGATYISKEGDSVTGPITSTRTPAQFTTNEFVTKQYVDNSHVQADWEETVSSSLAYIQNKPDLDLYRLVSDSYSINDTYSKTQIDELIANLELLDYDVTETLPTDNISSSTIYLVKNGDKYDLYLYIQNEWRKLGDTSIDLSNYITRDNLTDGSIHSIFVSKTGGTSGITLEGTGVTGDGKSTLKDFESISIGMEDEDEEEALIISDSEITDKTGNNVISGFSQISATTIMENGVTLEGKYLQLTGGTMIGPLVANSNITSNKFTLSSNYDTSAIDTLTVEEKDWIDNKKDILGLIVDLKRDGEEYLKRSNLTDYSIDKIYFKDNLGELMIKNDTYEWFLDDTKSSDAWTVVYDGWLTFNNNETAAIWFSSNGDAIWTQQSIDVPDTMIYDPIQTRVTPGLIATREIIPSFKPSSEIWEGYTDDEKETYGPYVNAIRVEGNFFFDDADLDNVSAEDAEWLSKHSVQEILVDLKDKTENLEDPIVYADIQNKPSINGVTIDGALTTEDLNIVTDEDTGWIRCEAPTDGETIVERIRARVKNGVLYFESQTGALYYDDSITADTWVDWVKLPASIIAKLGEGFSGTTATVYNTYTVDDYEWFPCFIASTGLVRIRPLGKGIAADDKKALLALQGTLAYPLD